MTITKSLPCGDDLTAGIEALVIEDARRVTDPDSSLPAAWQPPGSRCRSQPSSASRAATPDWPDPACIT